MKEEQYFTVGFLHILRKHKRPFIIGGPFTLEEAILSLEGTAAGYHPIIVQKTTIKKKGGRKL